MCARSRGLVGLLVVVAAAGCSAPPPPSAATEALESALLTAEELGGGFEEEFRGGVGVSGGAVCPESEFRLDDVGMMRATFTREVGGDGQIEIEEMAYVVEGGGIDVLMSELKSAYEACDGLVWTDYGEKKTVTTMAAPDVGDDSFAVAFPPAEYPEKGSYDYGRSVYVAAGDVFIEIRCWESLDGKPAAPVTSNADLYRIARQAVANLPS